MEQTFLKHFGNHDVEFNRLLYPDHYQVLIRIQNENPVMLNFYKNEGGWAVKEKEQDKWVENLFREITNAITENENKPGIETGQAFSG